MHSYTTASGCDKMRAIINGGCKRVFSSSSPPKSLLVHMEFSRRIQLQMLGRFFSTVEEPIIETEARVPRVRHSQSNCL